MLTGGVRTPSDALVGPIAVNALRSLHLDMLFIGVHGMTADAGLTTPNLLEAETDRALVATSARLVVVADHTKWGVRGLSRIAGLEDVDVFVSDPRAAGAGARDDQGARRPARDRSHGGRSGASPLRQRCRVTDASELRRDELTGILTYVVDSRQARPNLPVGDVPVLPGRARGAGSVRRALVREPLAGDAR